MIKVKEIKMMNTKRVSVYKNGKVVGDVSSNSTSIGASKVAHVKACEWGKVAGRWAWIAK